ncbi:hypothetical protein BAS10_02050 [Elizabethkingia meningoseptica]|uniref:hypothetical protein n=1 Tax=Elizabethkingia meningoseptica TaxID=238 RepID=UPI0009C69093|nr:hypothetical protein [Elizabethkingia meningoseptica]OPC01078.1 hypothetical protein BAS10_02050 [Elizabethkingia meningoseptica]
MGIIKEPKDIDFIIQSRPLTKEEQNEISEFIRMRKAQKAAKRNSKLQIKTNKATLKPKQKL